MVIMYGEMFVYFSTVAYTLETNVTTERKPYLLYE